MREYKRFYQDPFEKDFESMMQNAMNEEDGDKREREHLGTEQKTSGIEYTGLEKVQSCPVVPLHLFSWHMTRITEYVVDQHPYWYMNEHGEVDFQGENVIIHWPSSLSGRQIFTTNSERLYKVLQNHFVGHDCVLDKDAFSSTFTELPDGGFSRKIDQVWPTGEKIEAYLEYSGRVSDVDATHVMVDNHGLSSCLVFGAFKGQGHEALLEKSCVKIDGKEYDFAETPNDFWTMSGGQNFEITYSGISAYNRKSRFENESFVIGNPEEGTELRYQIQEGTDTVDYVEADDFYESRIRTKRVGDAEEIYEISTFMAGKDGATIKFNPSIPDPRYPFKEDFVGKFSLSPSRSHNGCATGYVQAKHFGKFVVFDFMPEWPEQSKMRQMQMTVRFTEPDKHEIRSQMFSQWGKNGTM